MGSFVKKNNDDETKKSTSGSFVRIGESKNRKGFSTAPKVDAPATTPISASQSRLSASESLWDRGSAFSGIDIDAKLTELEELRRQAAVDLDTTRVDELDKRMKSLRAQAGQQTVGDRVSDTLSAIVSGAAAQGTNVVGFASNAVNNPEYHQRSIARLEETLKSGRTTDGKVLTDAMRETIKSSIADHKKRVEELEKEDSFTNRTYKAADQMADDSAKYQSKAKQGLGAVGSTLVDAGVAFGQSALAGTVGAVTGTGMLPFAVTAFGGATQDARRNGATLDEQFTYGTAQAAKEFVTEKLFGLAVPQKIAGSVGSFDGLIEKGIRNVTERLAKTPAGQQALGGLMTWLAGGVTEGLEEGIGALVEETIINPHLRGFVEDERTTQEKFEEGLYNVLVGGVSGLLGVTNLLSYNPSAPTATATTAPKTETKAVRANPAAETATSPAAAPEVHQVQAQAEVTKVQNPEAEVLDAATTLFTQQGMNLKTAQKRAEIVGKLIRGEEVSDKDLNRIEPTSKQTKAIFTQLTGVQFPAEATGIEKLRDLYRSAHTVAQAAEAQQRAAEVQAIQQMSAEQIVERAQQARQATTPESDAQAARILAQARGEIAPDNTPLLSYKDFSARHKQVFPDASPQETARMYDLYLKDNQTISFMGRRMTRQQVLNTLNTAPGVERLTAEERAQIEADLNEKFDRELEAQKKDGKDATEHSERRRQTEAREKVQRSVNDWKKVLIKNSSVEDIVLDESLEENEAAFITPDGVIHLNAKRMTSEADVAYVLGHELVHSIDDSTARKAMVNDIIDTVRKITEPTESREDAIERYRKMYQEHENQVAARANREAKTISFEYAEEEYAADLMREVFLSGDMLNKLAAEKPSLMARIQEILQKWIASLKGNNDAVELYNELTALQDRFVKALQTDAAQQKLALENAGIEVDADTKSARHDRYSLDTWLESDYMTDPENAAKALAKAIGVSDEKAAKYIKDVNGVAKLIADDKTLLDYEAAPGMSSFVSNTEYGGSVDFSTICKKRRLFTGTFTAIQKALPNTALTSDEMIDIRKRMKDAGHEVSCGLCYVEGSRLNLGQYATEFLDKYTAEDHEFVPAIADLTTVEGQENLRLEHPDVYEAYIKYLNSLAQRKPKVYQTATAYNGEILKKFGGDKDAKVEEKNKNGGLRLQSFSDFEIIHLIDNMQVIVDMARVGLAGQAYTKVPDFAWAMGNTGLKINLSLIAKDVDADGHLVFDDVEGMPHEEAKKLRDAYSDNVGTIIVVFNDAQLKAAMADDFIDYIIPFHRSQLNQKQYDGLGLPKGTKNYTMVQNESYIEPVLNKNGKKTRPDNYMPNTYWDFNKSGKENAEAYLKMCAENNRRPKFSNVLEYNGDGSYSLPADGSADGYWKLLIDFKMYNNDGVGVPQQPVKPDFNIDEANRMLSEYKGGHSNFPVAQDIVDAFVADYKKNHPDVRYSVDADEGYNTDGPQWAIREGLLTKKDQAIFWRSIADIQKRGYNVPRTSTGEYIIDTGNRLLFTDADFKAPTLSRVITIDDRYEDTMADVKGWIYDAERVQAGNGEALRVIASIYGDSYISDRRAEDGGNHAWENRTGERADRGATADRTEENTGVTTQASEESGASSLSENAKYSITPQFEQWYKETYGTDLTSAQLKRRLQTAERRAAEAEHDKKAAELKNTIDSEMDLTAWMIHHTKKMREQKRVSDAKLADARKAKTEAVRTAVAETKEIERAKAEVQRDADRMAERRNAAKRLRTQENAYTNKVTEMKENAKLKRNAAKATLRDSRLAAKKRAEIETEQGLVDTIRKNPKQRTGVEKLQDAAQQLRTLGRSAYRNFVNMAESIDRFSKRQVSDMRAGTLVNILGGSASTMEAVFKKGLVDRAGNRIGESMSDVFLCWDEAHKKVNEGQQALLQDFMLHWHNIDRMSIVARAESALETFELNNEWLRDMDQKEFARLVAMTEKEVEKLGKYEAQQRAFEYVRLIRAYNEAQNKPIFADDKGNSVTAETSQRIVDQYLAEQPWLLDKANGIYEWWDLFMRNWAVGDTISEAEYNRMRQMYPHYVPTYRADKNGVGGAGFVGAGGATVSKAVKKAKGSHSEVMNIEDSFSNIVSKIIRLNRLNELYMNIIDTAMLDEDGTFADMAYFDWDWQDGAYANALITGSADIADLTDTVEETEKAGLEKVGSDYKLTGWLNGRKYTAYISEDLYKSIGMVTGHLANDFEQNLLKVGNTLTTPMKTAITGINPTFAIRNLSRDLPTAIINSISGLNFPKYYAQAAKEIAKNSDHWKTFQALGGTHATYYNDNQGFTKAMSRGQNPAAWAVGKMGAFNEITEAQTRFAEYLATVDKLGDTYEARLQGIKNAAEVTVDFSRKGRYGKVINAWVPYWNPAVQGIDKTVRSVIDSPDGSAVWKQASKTLGRATMTTILFEAILYGVLKALDRDDEWEELNDRTKDTYYCIPLKDSNRFLKIPKNREWGVILGTPFMRMLEWANGREDPFENYIETSLEPNFLPPAIFRPDSGGGFASDIIGISQALDLAKNEDFAGRTIVPYAYQQGTLSQQFDNETSALAKKLGELFDRSPMQIDYIIGDYFGDFGDMFINATSEATWSGEQNIGETALEIVTNPFFADARYSNASVSKYYDLMDELGRVVQDKKNQMGNDAAKETIEYQTEKAIDEMYGKQISELNRIVRELPDGTEKDNAKSQIAQLTKEAIEFYNDSMAGKVSNPILTATYNGYSESVAKELTRMDNYSEQYSFKPRTTAPTSYEDPKNKKNEYRLDDEQKEYFMNVYAEKYDEIFEQLIQSSKYRKADNEKKAEMLEDAKADVNDAAKEELFDWLEDNRVRSTPKK